MIKKRLTKYAKMASMQQLLALLMVLFSYTSHGTGAVLKKDKVYSECNIKGHMDQGEYAGVGSLSYNISRIDEHGNFEQESGKIEIDEQGNFDLELNTASFSIMTMIYYVDDSGKSWGDRSYYYLNGSKKLNLSFKTEDKRVILNKRKISDENLLAFME